MLLGQLVTHIQKNEIGLLPYTQKINSIWIINHNVRPKTVTFSEKIIGVNLYILDLGKDFLDTTAKHKWPK